MAGEIIRVTAGGRAERGPGSDPGDAAKRVALVRAPANRDRADECPTRRVVDMAGSRGAGAEGRARRIAPPRRGQAGRRPQGRGRFRAGGHNNRVGHGAQGRQPPRSSADRDHRIGPAGRAAGDSPPGRQIGPPARRSPAGPRTTGGPGRIGPTDGLTSGRDGGRPRRDGGPPRSNERDDASAGAESAGPSPLDEGGGSGHSERGGQDRRDRAPRGRTERPRAERPGGERPGGERPAGRGRPARRDDHESEAGRGDGTAGRRTSSLRNGPALVRIAGGRGD